MNKIKNHLVVSKNIHDNTEYKSSTLIAIYNDALDGFNKIDKVFSENGINSEFIHYLSTYESPEYFYGNFLVEFYLDMNKIHKVGKLKELFDYYNANYKQDGYNIESVNGLVILYSAKNDELYINIELLVNGSHCSFGEDNNGKRLTLKDFFNKDKIVKLLNSN